MRVACVRVEEGIFAQQFGHQQALRIAREIAAGQWLFAASSDHP
jgi:hypothetical protein